MTIRDSVVWVHRWLALSAGVFWAIAAFTGGILVFQNQIDHALNGGRFEVSGGTLPPGGLDRALAEQFPGETVSSMTWLREDGVIRLTLRGPAGSRSAFLDAGAGRQVTETRPRTELIGRVHRLHASLLTGRPGGLLVTAASFAALLSMITGLYLWWPGIRTFFRGFAVRLRRGLYVFNFDLHQVLGIVTFALLFVMTGTGVIMGVPGAGARIARLVMPTDVEQAVTAAIPSAGPAAASAAPGVEALVATAERAASGQVIGLAFPAGGPSRVEVRIQPLDPGSPTSRVLLDPADGHILDISYFAPSKRAARFNVLVSRWHTGRFSSLLVRILFSAASILGSVLAATGFLVWWLKRTRMRASTKRRQGSPTAA